MCCGSADACLSSGLCRNQGTGPNVGTSYARGTCMDPTWSSPVRPQRCRINPDAAINEAAYDFGAGGVQVWECVGRGYAGPGAYCCELAREKTACCQTPSAVFSSPGASIGNALDVQTFPVSSSAETTSSTTRRTTATSTESRDTTTTSASQTSGMTATSIREIRSTTASLATNATAAPIPTVSSGGGELSNGAKIGLGIGIGVCVAVVVAAAILTWYHIRNRAVGAPTPAGGNGDPYTCFSAGKPAVNKPVEMHGRERGPVEMNHGFEPTTPPTRHHKTRQTGCMYLYMYPTLTKPATLEMDNRFMSSDAKLLRSGLFSDVKVKCGDTTWQLHKNILCTRSQWFEKALTGSFEEAKTGVVEIENFAPRQIDSMLQYIYTGACDIPSMKPSEKMKTNFVTCYEVYTVADYFGLSAMAQIALDTLSAEFDNLLGPIQVHYESAADWLPELCEAIRRVYAHDHTAVQSARQLTPIRAAFVGFAHTARFYFLQDPDFNRFLDEDAPVFALDLFRAMRDAGDFCAALPEPTCSYCRMKPTRGGKDYYTHIAPETLKLTACCSTCALRKDLGSGMSDWSGKKRTGGSDGA
ncbi:hypothetical protein C7999DRAFT_41797 [Corynascus novoguineensis]|uniref:BTB domain-containing protein n=1 Tax=Corynascus novoguineensis TaxID=1126955 RepID=A0AAN7CT67_9PEZI|nr:hypothetical protein C7999DRAFT_41797 [Corynascus novoguineensis]